MIMAYWNKRFLRKLHSIKNKFPTIAEDAEDLCDFIDLSKKNQYPRSSFSMGCYLVPVLKGDFLSDICIWQLRKKITVDELESYYSKFMKLKEPFRHVKAKIKSIILALVELDLFERKSLNFWDRLTPKAFEEEVIKIFDILEYETELTPYRTK